MKLLMITRKIDRDDWLAGHSFTWAQKLDEFLKRAGGELVVICLERGNVAGLEGTRIYSLGKEHGSSRIVRVARFIRLASKLVKEVDGVFCHQNPEYAIAIAWWAKLARKKIVSWYAHKAVTWKTWLMLWVSDKVLTASSESFRIKSQKVAVEGHGIDLKKFAPLSLFAAPVRQQFRIVTVGRISPVKDLETLITAFKVLVREEKIPNLQCDVIGAAALPSDQGYFSALKRMVVNFGLENTVHFVPAIPHARIPGVYQQADLFINLSQTGSIDKAVLEAMACECPVLTSNEAFRYLLFPFEDLCMVAPRSAQELVKKILTILSLNVSDRRTLGANLRKLVETHHSLDRLAKRIIASFA
ncbi:MAG: glycosyltransferase family 4 protein [Candidatus Doudnabacteria bacterium]|nr:glycosyltransferase family 4 protein [Candidatus Doudnabacteria bacterium]